MYTIPSKKKEKMSEFVSKNTKPLAQVKERAH